MTREKEPLRRGANSSTEERTPAPPKEHGSEGRGASGAEQSPTILFAAKQPDPTETEAASSPQGADILSISEQLEAERARADAAEAELRRRREANTAAQRRYRERNREAYNARQAEYKRYKRQQAKRSESPTKS